MIRAIQHNCARTYQSTIAALETVVECTVDIVCMQEPPRERGGVGISDSAYEKRKRKTIWTVIQKGSGLVVDEGKY
jgi:hypothetical protein